MLYVIQFHDDPDKLEVRGRCAAAHRDFLDRNRDRILMAGSLREEPGGTPSGGLWVVDVAGRDEAERIYVEDPYWTEGLRRAVSVKFWSKAFSDRKVLI